MSRPLPSDLESALEAAKEKYPHVVEDIDLSGVVLDGLDLTGFWLLGCSFDEAVFRDTELYRCHFNESSFRHADLTGVPMAKSESHRSTFQGARMAGANLLRFRAVDSDFRNADLSNADMHKARISHCDLRGANLRNVRYRRTGVWDGTLLAGADLTAAAGTINGDVEINVGTPEAPIVLIEDAAREWLHDAGASPLAWSRTPQEIAQAEAEFRERRENRERGPSN